jgi:hypothetical protein
MGSPNFRTVPIIGAVIRNGVPAFSCNVRFHKLLIYNRVLSGADLDAAYAWLSL